MNNILLPITFIDLMNYGKECKKDKHNQVILTEKDEFPRFLLSIKHPKKAVTVCKREDVLDHNIPIISFQWCNNKLGINDNQFGIFMHYKGTEEMIPAVISEIDVSIYEDKYVKYFGPDGVIIQNFLIDILNDFVYDKKEDKDNENKCERIGIPEEVITVCE